MQTTRWVLSVIISLSSCSGPAIAQGSADNYPNKPVRVIIPSAPGSSTDTEIRLYTNKLLQNLGQPFVIVHKPGAGQAIGNTFVAQSIPDGYTLGIASGGFTYLPAFYGTKPPYDAVKDFAPVALMSNRPTMFVVNPALPVHTVAEYIAFARKNPNAINFATTGQGASYHLVGAWLHGLTKTQVTFVHYKGGGPLWIDMVAGRLSASPGTFLQVLPFVKAGKVRPIANMGRERSPLLPDLPTMEEQGFPGFEYPSWSGIVAPAKTPPAIIAKLNAAFVRAGRSPDVMQQIEQQGAIMVASTPAFFAKTITNDTARWRKVVQENNLKLEE